MSKNSNSDKQNEALNQEIVKMAERVKENFGKSKDQLVKNYSEHKTTEMIVNDISFLLVMLDKETREKLAQPNADLSHLEYTIKTVLANTITKNAEIDLDKAIEEFKKSPKEHILGPKAPSFQDKAKASLKEAGAAFTKAFRKEAVKEEHTVGHDIIQHSKIIKGNAKLSAVIKTYNDTTLTPDDKTAKLIAHMIEGALTVNKNIALQLVNEGYFYRNAAEIVKDLKITEENVKTIGNEFGSLSAKGMKSEQIMATDKVKRAMNPLADDLAAAMKKEGIKSSKAVMAIAEKLIYADPQPMTKEQRKVATGLMVGMISNALKEDMGLGIDLRTENIYKTAKHFAVKVDVLKDAPDKVLKNFGKTCTFDGENVTLGGAKSDNLEMESGSISIKRGSGDKIIGVASNAPTDKIMSSEQPSQQAKVEEALKPKPPLQRQGAQAKLNTETEPKQPSKPGMMTKLSNFVSKPKQEKAAPVKVAHAPKQESFSLEDYPGPKQTSKSNFADKFKNLVGSKKASPEPESQENPTLGTAPRVAAPKGTLQKMAGAVTNVTKRFTKDASQTVKSPTKAVDGEAFYEVLGAEKPSLDRQGQAAKPVEGPKQASLKQNVSVKAKLQSAVDTLEQGAKKTLNDVTEGLSQVLKRNKVEKTDGQEATTDAPNKNKGRGK
jgi:hypothetical protein